MSDQSYQGTEARTIDGSKLINVGGGSGITQINGDATPHQIIAAVTPLAISPGPPGTETLTVATFSPVARGVVPPSGGGILDFLRADGSWVPPLGATPTIISANSGGPVSIPVGATTVIVTAPAVVSAGTYLVMGQALSDPLTGAGNIARIILLQNGVPVGEVAAESSTGGTVPALGLAVTSHAPLVLAPGDILTLSVGPNNTGGGGNQNWQGWLYAIQVISAGGGGGGGITSINGDVTPAQIIAAGTGVSVTPGPPGTNTIGNVGVLSIAGFDGGGAQAGVLTSRVLVGGISNPAVASVLSSPGLQTLDLESFTNVHAGLVSNPGGIAATNYLRADNTFAPLPTSIQLSSSAAAGTVVPDSVITPLATLTVPAFVSGNFLIFYSAGVVGVIAEILDVVLRVNGVVSPLGNTIGLVETAAQDCQASGSSAALVTLAPGDVVDVAVDHHGGGAGTTSTASSLFAFKMSF